MAGCEQRCWGVVDNELLALLQAGSSRVNLGVGTPPLPLRIEIPARVFQIAIQCLLIVELWYRLTG